MPIALGRMSAVGRIAENICSQRVFRLLTRLGHRAVAVSAGSPALAVDPRDWAMACDPGLWSPRNHLNREDGNESSALSSIRSVMPQSDQAARPDGPDRGQTKFR